MAFRRTSGGNSWFQEQLSLVNSASSAELAGLRDTFDSKFEDAVGAIKEATGINMMKDAKRMLDNPTIMQEYKTLLLEPILDELRTYPVTDNAEKVHLESVADQLSDAWDSSVQSFLYQESYNVANYLPLSTLDFPALIKQYIRFLGKDIIPVQNASSVNIEQRIFIKYLVNNQTGEEYETPAVYFQKDEDGQPLWKKLWNAGKGLRLNDKTVLPLTTIQAATNKRYSLFNWLQDDNGNATQITPNVRTRISYDFGIQYVEINGKKVKLPNGGIAIDIQTGGVFLNGGITEDMKLAVVDANNKATGEVVTGVADRLSGVVDFIKGTVTATSCGTITGIYVSGHVSNETNLRTVGFREYPEIRKFTIADGMRFQLPFTVEDFAEANSSLNFNLYNRLVQEVVTEETEYLFLSPSKDACIAQLLQRLSQIDNAKLIQFVNDFGGKEELVKAYRRAIAIISSFMAIYPNVLPAETCMRYKVQSPSDNCIATCSFQDIKIFYQDAYESLLSLFFFPVGLDNYFLRGDFNIFSPSFADVNNKKGIKSIADYRKLDNGTKVNKKNDSEQFQGMIGTHTDRLLRNGIGHNNYLFDGITQEITYYHPKKPNSPIHKSLMEMAEDCIRLTRSAVILSEIILFFLREVFRQENITTIIHPQLYKGIKVNDKCPCGSGKKYKDCCRIAFEEISR